MVCCDTLGFGLIGELVPIHRLEFWARLFRRQEGTFLDGVAGFLLGFHGMRCEWSGWDCRDSIHFPFIVRAEDLGRRVYFEEEMQRA